MHKFSPARRVAAAISIAAIGAAVFAVSLPANAASPALIDPAMDGQASLVVHKFEQPVVAGDEATGLPEDVTGFTALDGIEFQVQQIPGYDLTTVDGWVNGTQLSVDEAIAAVDGVTPITGVTGADGVSGEIVFDELDLGLYVVSERLTADQMNAGITGGEPFVVALPMTHPVNLDEWLYTVHVYPKNAVDTITKSITDEGAYGLGDEVIWNISAAIPAGGVTGRYVITDTVDRRLAITGVEVTVDGITDLAEGPDGDYEVEYTAQPNVDNDLTVTFTAAGREALNSAKVADAGAQVHVEIATDVVSLGVTTTSIIPNQAFLFPNDSRSESEGIPSDTPETRWGTLTILKTGTDTNGAGLANAEFQVFASEEAALAGTAPIEVGGETTFRANAQGVATVAGLRLSDFENGEELADGAERLYWVVETKAPTGYELNPKPMSVLVVAHETAVVDLEFVNAPHNDGFELPLTGGTGTAVFIGAGALLILAGLGVSLLFRARARRSEV